MKGCALIRWGFVTLLLVSSLEGLAQVNPIPSERILSTQELKQVLKSEVRSQIFMGSNSDEEALASYFRKKFSERYFYDWQTFDDRFSEYNQLYHPQSGHQSRAEDHMAKFADSTQWVLPFNYLYGAPVNAYALRHLARSHKMVDIAFQYFYDNQNPKYVDYFTTQLRSLNAALEKGAYEKIEDGNGVYEVFRSGYRILNWMRIHNMFLGQRAYSDRDQLTTIATMLQHGQHLYEHNSAFRSGNHQTRGMSALAQLAILFPDFEGTDKWLQLAMTRLEEHLDREINDDGFQFERSVHYHISDIGNYFYVYQLAKINGVEVSDAWTAKLKALFTTLVKIAYPNKTAPVLQDDTDRPWAEFNEIAPVMSLGYLLFEDPEFGYLASNEVDKTMYWFLSGKQVEGLKNIKVQKPNYSSLAFDQTGYYIMRQGWGRKDNMLVISAGLDDLKPDHQHGDMLGIEAYASGNVILPNYQVRYSLPDYEFFKNSMVKNVALVDDELQGKKYKGNKGGSGFGKFGELPNPKTILWDSTRGREWFIGTHDGFANIGVSYSRQVINVDDDFWIVKDNFNASEPHDYKQVWQGHYTLDDNPTLIRSTFNDGAGLDIYQLSGADEVIQDGKRGKEWSVIVKKGQQHFSFITILYPFPTYDKCLDTNKEKMDIVGWVLDKSDLKVSGSNLRSLNKDGKHYLFNLERITIHGSEFVFAKPVDAFFDEEAAGIYFLEDGPESLAVTGKKKFRINVTTYKKSAVVKPGDVISIFTR